MDTISSLLADLVAIDSVNPDLVPGGAGEGHIAQFVADWLRAAGLEVRLDEIRPGRPNVVAIARGKGGGRTLLLNGHLDTVGVAGYANPHQPAIDGATLGGRGAYDMKGGLAACMVAIAAARAHPLRGDVIFAGVMDEEYEGLGTLDVAARYHADAAIIAEPTEFELVVAHKGFVWLEVETEGEAAHGSIPGAVDAIAQMGPVLVGLAALNHDLLQRPPHPLLGSGSLHASLISGGQELSSYPERCLLQIERRTVPGETPEGAEEELAAIVCRCVAADPALRAVVRRGVDRPPMETPADAPIIAVVQRHAGAVLGGAVDMVGVPYWTDAASLAAAGVSTVLFGPCGDGAHATHEWVDLDSVRQCAAIYERVITDFCA